VLKTSITNVKNTMRWNFSYYKLFIGCVLRGSSIWNAPLFPRIEIFAAIFAAIELRVFLCESIYSNSALHTTATFSDI